MNLKGLYVYVTNDSIMVGVQRQHDWGFHKRFIDYDIMFLVAILYVTDTVPFPRRIVWY